MHSISVVMLEAKVEGAEPKSRKENAFAFTLFLLMGAIALSGWNSFLSLLPSLLMLIFPGKGSFTDTVTATYLTMTFLSTLVYARFDVAKAWVSMLAVFGVTCLCIILALIISLCTPDEISLALHLFAAFLGIFVALTLNSGIGIASAVPKPYAGAVGAGMPFAGVISFFIWMIASRGVFPKTKDGAIGSVWMLLGVFAGIGVCTSICQVILFRRRWISNLFPQNTRSCFGLLKVGNFIDVKNAALMFSTELRAEKTRSSKSISPNTAHISHISPSPSAKSHAREDDIPTAAVSVPLDEKILNTPATSDDAKSDGGGLLTPRSLGEGDADIERRIAGMKTNPGGGVYTLENLGHLGVLKRGGLLCVIMLVSFFQSYLVFPNIGPVGWKSSLVITDVTMGTFQVLDFLGRFLPNFIPWLIFRPKTLAWSLIPRCLVCATFVLSMEYPNATILGDSWFKIIQMAILAFSNGIYAASATIMMPTMYDDAAAKSAAGSYGLALGMLGVVLAQWSSKLLKHLLK